MRPRRPFNLLPRSSETGPPAYGYMAAPKSHVLAEVPDACGLGRPRRWAPLSPRTALPHASSRPSVSFASSRGRFDGATHRRHENRRGASGSRVGGAQWACPHRRNGGPRKIRALQRPGRENTSPRIFDPAFLTAPSPCQVATGPRNFDGSIIADDTQDSLTSVLQDNFFA